MGASLQRCTSTPTGPSPRGFDVDAPIDKAAQPDEARLAFFTWRAAHHAARCSRLQAQLESQDRRVAEMISEHEETSATRARAIRIIAREATESDSLTATDTITCCVCFELREASTASHCDASTPHAVCTACMKSYCAMLWDSHFSGHASRVACPCSDECRASFPPEQLAKTVGGRRLATEMVRRRSVDLAARLVLSPPVRFKSASATDAVEDVERDAEGYEARGYDVAGRGAHAARLGVRLAYLRHDGTYRGYMCARCAFGPMEHSRCSSLTDHHGQGFVSNACPQCGHLESDASSLMRWDGGDRQHLDI